MVPLLAFVAVHAAVPFLAATGQTEQPPRSVLSHADVAFMYRADTDAYKAYGATFVAWGGAETPAEVARHRELGIRCTGSMWCLTAGAELIHERPELREAVAVDIEGKPIEVPWLFDHTYQGTKTYFGCTNHPAFRAHNRDMVRAAMAAGADGLHIDDHLGAAHPALWQGGGLCDHCIAGFRAFLKKHATAEELKGAGVADIDSFDYRDLIRKFATTRETYKKVQRSIPLMDLFLRFHLEAAAENVRELGEVAAAAAGHPVLLSANACLPAKEHTHVIKHLTHIVGEVHQGAAAGTADLGRAIEAYRLATRLGKPLAATASGWDWAFVKEKGCADLVRTWIALAYAHGQLFMAPHPKRQWCFTDKLGTHWYEAPIEEYAPMYRFVRANARWFKGFEEPRPAPGAEAGAGPGALEFPAKTIATLRRAAGRATAIHVVNLDYDAERLRMRPARGIAVTLPRALVKPGVQKATVLRYDAEPASIPVAVQGDRVRIEIPALSIWTLAVLDD